MDFFNITAASCESFILADVEPRLRCIIGRTWACDNLPPPLQDTSKYESGANRTASSPIIKRHFNASTFTSLFFDCTFFPILKIHAPALCPRGGRDKQSPPLQGTSDADRTTASPLIKRHFNASTRTSLHFDLQVFFSHSQHSRSRLMPEGGNRQEISFLAGCK